MHKNTSFSCFLHFLKIPIIISLLFYSTQSNHLIASPSNSSSTQKIIAEKDTNSNLVKLDSIGKLSTKDSINKEIQLNNSIKEVRCYRNANDFTLGQWFIILFIPIIMIVFSSVFTYKLWNSKEFTLYKIIGTGTNDNSKEPIQSTSRFIALLTGLTSIFISCTLTMYYGYFMVAECNNPLNLDGLWKIIAGLGIGVIPYGINVWNKNIKEEKGSNN